MTSTEAADTAALTQDDIPLSEMDKAAVLTLIREEVLRVTPTHTQFSEFHDYYSVISKHSTLLLSSSCPVFQSDHH